MRYVALVLAVGLSTAVAAQTPRPFPVPSGEGRRQAPPPQAPLPQAPPPQAPAAAATSDAPTEATLGVPVYPNAEFIASYDAGRGQRYYLFGVQAGYAQIVAYYKTVLDEDGDQVFEQPATHMFEVGRFDEDTMTFPPGVTVKDFTWGSEGYLNPTPGATPDRFPTIIQIVPPPRGARR